MKRFFNFLIVIGGCVAAFYGIGVIVPRNQTEASRTNMGKGPDAVYALVGDVSAWPSWHPDVARVEQRPNHNNHPVWRITNKVGETFDLEVVTADEPLHWSAQYERDGKRTTLKLDQSWTGQGAMVLLSRGTDIHDHWLRAKDFLLPNGETSAIGLLNALSTALGETPRAERKN